MAKRPSILDDLDLKPAFPATTPSPSTDGASLQPARKKPAKTRDVQHTSVYIPRSAYERLREIAFHERKKIHDLIMDGVDSVILARGHSESARK